MTYPYDLPFGILTLKFIHVFTNTAVQTSDSTYLTTTLYTICTMDCIDLYYHLLKVIVSHSNMELMTLLQSTCTL